MDALMTVKELADYLGLQVSTIYNWAQDQRVPAIKIGRSWRFKRADIDLWLARHSVPAADEEA